MLDRIPQRLQQSDGLPGLHPKHHRNFLPVGKLQVLFGSGLGISLFIIYQQSLFNIICTYFCIVTAMYVVYIYGKQSRVGIYI